MHFYHSFQVGVYIFGFGFIFVAVFFFFLHYYIQQSFYKMDHEVYLQMNDIICFDFSGWQPWLNSFDFTHMWKDIVYFCFSDFIFSRVIFNYYNSVFSLNISHFYCSDAFRKVVLWSKQKNKQTKKG